MLGVAVGKAALPVVAWKVMRPVQVDSVEGVRLVSVQGDSEERAREVWVFARVACGKVAEVWVLVDNLTMLRQLGIISDEELRDAGTPTVATPVP